MGAGCSFVVCPHSDDLHRVFHLEDLVSELMLDVDAARVRSRKVAQEFLEGQRALPGIALKDIE